MRGVTFPGEREIEFVEFPDPTPGPGEAVLEVKASGLCGSDLHSFRRPKGTGSSFDLPGWTGPVIAGHEPCGIVVATGSGVPDGVATVGDRVMVHHYAGCCACDQCRSGWQQLCQEVPVRVFGNNDHGAHAPYIKVPANTLVPLPDELSFAVGAAISCGFGTAYGALERLAVDGSDTIAIFGQGPVGLSATQIARAYGARIIALDISPERLAQAKAHGADLVVNPAETDAVAAIREATRGYGADLSLDTSSSPQARIAAVRCLKVWGKACFVGEGGNVTMDVSPDLLRRQITVIGSWTFSSMGQAACARFVADRGVDVEGLFTDRWRLEEAEEAYRVFDRQTSGKGVFLM